MYSSLLPLPVPEIMKTREENEFLLNKARSWVKNRGSGVIGQGSQVRGHGSKIGIRDCESEVASLRLRVRDCRLEIRSEIRSEVGVRSQRLPKVKPAIAGRRL